MSFTGGCYCGAVRYECSGAQIAGAHCHCARCRKVSGTGHTSNMAVREAELRITGELRFHEAPSDSGNMVSRGFCPTCGSPILARNSGMPGVAVLAVSSLDDSDVFTPQLVVYASRAPSWDHIDPALVRFETMPPPESTPDMSG